MSYQVGKKVKAVYQIARGEREGGLAEFFIHDSTGTIVCTITTPHFADEETVAELRQVLGKRRHSSTCV